MYILPKLPVSDVVLVTWGTASDGKGGLCRGALSSQKFPLSLSPQGSRVEHVFIWLCGSHSPFFLVITLPMWIFYQCCLAESSLDPKIQK